MKTMKLLFGLMLAFSTIFLFDRCNEPGQTSDKDTTKNTLSSAQERSINDTNDYVEGCEILNGACDNSARYGTQVGGGGIEISTADGKERVLAFYNKYDKQIIKGGFISKEAIDAIFCNNPDFNGLYCYISKGTGDEQAIIIEGWRDDEGGNTRTKVTFNSSIPSTDRYKVFMTETLCPLMCGACGAD